MSGISFKGRKVLLDGEHVADIIGERYKNYSRKHGSFMAGGYTIRLLDGTLLAPVETYLYLDDAKVAAQQELSRRENPAGKLQFVESYYDPSSGQREWDIYLGAEDIGSIEKSTEWRGDGYVASGYDVTIEWYRADEDIEIEESFPVTSRTDARAALADAKQFVRDLVKGYQHAKAGPLRRNGSWWMTMPRIVADEIFDRQREGSETMNESFGDMEYMKRGVKVEVLNLDRAAWSLVNYAELTGTPSDAARAMVKVAERIEKELGQPGLHTRTYEREPAW